MTNKSVILVTADSLRADHCGWLNNSVSTTPFLDSVADDSVVFENAIAAGPRTPSSVPVMMSGEHFGITNQQFSERGDRVRHHMLTHGTVAQEFQKEGYTTIGFSVNPWTFEDAGFDQGFDTFVEVGGDVGGYLPNRFKDTRLEAPAQYLDYWIHNKSMFCTWHSFYDRIVDAVENAEEPYFLWIFLLDTHNPFLVPRSDRTETNIFSMYYSFLRGNSVLNKSEQSTMDNRMSPYVLKNLKRSYRDTIRSTDRFVEKLWNEVEKDDPVLVFNSDHGEAFNEHETFGHQRVLYEENIHVPLLVYNTERRDNISEPFGLVQLPELLVSSGFDEGLGVEELYSEYVFSRTENEMCTAVRSLNWKYIHSKGKDKLYHLEKDIGERNNLAQVNSRKQKEMYRQLSIFCQGLPKIERVISNNKPSENINSLLKSLGYLE